MKRLLLAGLLALAGGLGGPALARDNSMAAASNDLQVRVQRDVAYGPDRRQRFDAYLPGKPTGPVLLFVHGGAWSAGDKAERGAILAKVRFFTARGYVVVSTNYRMLPQADPLEQARDVARALALVQRQAPGWGADPKRVLLMGHSSGAHLVALLNSNPKLAQEQGATSWKAAVLLDSPALDVPLLMRARHPPLYDRAFGADPARWNAVSPKAVLVPAVPPALYLCSSLGGDTCPQANSYEERASALHVQMTIWTQPMSHMDIDRKLGEPGGYTDAVALWIRSVL